MIHYTTGNIFESGASAIVNTVNLVGVMGKGLALQFKKRYPLNFKLYKKACETGAIGIGRMFVTQCGFEDGPGYIVNFPTKNDWRRPSEYSYIEEGLADLKRIITEYRFGSIAIPPLGAGNGGLDWARVKALIQRYLGDADCDIIVYEPSDIEATTEQKKTIKLTPARAMMLDVLYYLVAQGEFVSEFSGEKVCYFLQRLGAKKYFNLDFSPKYYGPYSGKVRHVLYALDGSYITGYADKNKQPFEPMGIVGDKKEEVGRYISTMPELGALTDKCKRLLDGFCSDFSLELLSTVDYILSTKGIQSTSDVYAEISAWSHRKSEIFKEFKYIDLATQHLREFFDYRQDGI